MKEKNSLFALISLTNQKFSFKKNQNLTPGFFTSCLQFLSYFILQINSNFVHY